MWANSDRSYMNGVHLLHKRLSVNTYLYVNTNLHLPRKYGHELWGWFFFTVESAPCPSYTTFTLLPCCVMANCLWRSRYINCQEQNSRQWPHPRPTASLLISRQCPTRILHYFPFYCSTVLVLRKTVTILFCSLTGSHITELSFNVCNYHVTSKCLTYNVGLPKRLYSVLWENLEILRLSSRLSRFATILYTRWYN